MTNNERILLGLSCDWWLLLLHPGISVVQIRLHSQGAWVFSCNAMAFCESLLGTSFYFPRTLRLVIMGNGLSIVLAVGLVIAMTDHRLAPGMSRELPLNGPLECWVNRAL